MSKVSKKFILDNVSKMYGFGGKVDIDFFKTDIKVPKGGFETTLSKEEINKLDNWEIAPRFKVLVPQFGWVDCWSKTGQR